MRKSYWLLLVLLCSLAIGWGANILSGYHGVKHYEFGPATQMRKIYGEGFQWHLPWNSFFVYQTQLDERKEDLHVLSADGASIELEASVWFRPMIDKLDSLQVTAGPNYYKVAIEAAFRGEAQSIVGRYKPDEIYSSGRELIASGILESMREVLQGKHVEMENVIIRNVTLPRKITDPIEEKLAADQEQMRMQFVLMKEKQEAKRKRIKAQGIRDFQATLSRGLTKNLLLGKGIEATEKLAQSPNTKIVVIGSSESGLPLILGGEGK
jgi:regulator of protease activity HflC (stomatin/prohibitin superfamily)